MKSQARKRFRFDVAPSDSQLWAIGMMISQWTALEQAIKVFAHAMTDEDDRDDPDRKLFDSTRPMQRRIQQWEDLVKARMRSPKREQLLEIINQIKQVEDQRDKIVHGTWSGKENTDAVSDSARGVFSWGNPGPKFSWKLSYDDILKVALRIDQLHGALFDFAIQITRSSGVAQFRVGEALRSVSMIPKKSP